MSIAAAEQAIYDGIWQHPSYREHSPGLVALPRFRRLTGAVPPASVADFGCGSGRVALELARAGHRHVVATDQTTAGLEIMPICEPGIDVHFVRHCLWQPWPDMPVDYGFCCDVLEHVPTELTALAITRMLEACAVSLYLEVSTEPDSFGILAGQPLHKTVRPFTWWRDLCAEIGEVRHGIDLLDRAAFVLG